MKKGKEEFKRINNCDHYFLHFPLVESDIVILHLHGGPGQSTSNFAYLQEQYFTYANFVYYDQRGAGKTQSKNKSKSAEITTEQLLDDLDKIIDVISNQYHTNKIILLGHSWGSILGTRYIQIHPEKVIGYVGMGQVINVYRGEKRAFDRLGEVINEKDRKAYEKLRSAFTEDSFDTQRMMEIRKLESKYGFMKPFSSFAMKYIKSPYFKWKDAVVLLTSFKTNLHLLDELNDFDAEKSIHYDCPIFYLCGRLDWQVPTVLVEEYIQLVEAPKKNIYFVEAGSHTLDIDDSKDFHTKLECIVNEIIN